jgi:hypothetical protein
VPAVAILKTIVAAFPGLVPAGAPFSVEASIVSSDTALVSTAHGHGPECSTIRKIVRFKLDPGSYRLYLTGLAQPRVKAMLVVGE